MFIWRVFFTENSQILCVKGCGGFIYYVAKSLYIVNEYKNGFTVRTASFNHECINPASVAILEKWKNCEMIMWHDVTGRVIDISTLKVYVTCMLHQFKCKKIWNNLK